MYPQYQSKTQASCHRCIGWSTQYLNEPVLLSFCLDHDSNLNWSTCKRGKFHKRFPLPTLKWKNFLLRIKFFLFRVNTFNKGGWFIGKQTEVTTGNWQTADINQSNMFKTGWMAYKDMVTSKGFHITLCTCYMYVLTAIWWQWLQTEDFVCFLKVQTSSQVKKSHCESIMSDSLTGKTFILRRVNNSI